MMQEAEVEEVEEKGKVDREAKLAIGKRRKGGSRDQNERAKEEENGREGG